MSFPVLIQCICCYTMLYAIMARVAHRLMVLFFASSTSQSEGYTSPTPAFGSFISGHGGCERILVWISPPVMLAVGHCAAISSEGGLYGCFPTSSRLRAIRGVSSCSRNLCFRITHTPPVMDSLPTEILMDILEQLADEIGTFLALGRVSKQFSRLTRRLAFSKLTIHHLQDLVDFVALARARTSTIPLPLKCRYLNLEGVNDSFCQSEEAHAFLHSITVDGSLALTFTDGGLLDAFVHAEAGWKEAVSKLKIVGGTHAASTMFKFIASFPHLQYLKLQDTELVAPQDNPSAQFHFPQGITHLSLSQCPHLWLFIKLHILPGGGFANVKWIYIRERIILEAGVANMFDCFKAPQFEGVQDIVLDAVYDDDDPHIDIDMAQFLVPKPFMKMRELKRLRLNLAYVPSRVATNFLGWCSLYRSSHSIEVIDVHVPHSTTRWADGSPAQELENMLDGMGARDPAVATPDDSKAKLVVRGFPGPLPQSIASWGGSAVSGLHGYSIAFHECDWERLMGGV